MKRRVLCLLCCASISMEAAEPIVVIVRHAEKKTATGGDDPDLSPAGRARAEMLARIMKDAGVTAIFTSEFKRTQETAAPLAKALAIRTAIVPAKDTAALVARLRELSGNALVVGHGNTIPNLIKALGIDSPVSIPENDFKELFVIHAR